MLGSTSDERIFAEVKRLCYSGLEDVVLLGEVVERLSGAVPFDAYCASRFDPLSRLIARSVYEGLGGEKGARLFFEYLYFEDEVSGYNWSAQKQRPVIRLSEITGGKLERALRHRELTGPLGLGHEMHGVSKIGRETWSGVTLYRERGRRDFDAREAALMRRIAPHLGAGVKAAMLYARARVEPDEGAPGMLVLDDRGHVSHYTASAERWLRDLEDLRPGWREGGGLPAAVWMVNGALRKALKPESGRDHTSVPRLCVRARSGRWLTLQAARSEPSTEGGNIMILIEPSGPKELAWLNATTYGLSQREKEVVGLVLQGASTKAISQASHISEYTVQTHLSHVFEKVRVRGRRALVKRLFFDNLSPSLLE